MTQAGGTPTATQGAEAEVTVVIPVWGPYAGRVLEESIASIRAQEVPVNLLVVENDANGSLPPVAKATRVSTGHRVSLGAARNAGLYAAETKLVVFWDADDVMLPGSLKRLTDLMQADDRLVACAPSILDGRTGARHHWPRPITFPLARSQRLFAIINGISSLFPTTGCLIRTASARDAGGFADADGGDDWVLGVSLAFRGRIHLDAHLGRLYKRHGDSLSARWRTVPDIVAHARLVRQRLRGDRAVPPWVRHMLPLIAICQWLVMFVVRPVSRRTGARRDALA